MITPDQKSVRLSVLNRHPSADWSLDLRFDGYEVASVEVHEMYSDDLGASVCPFPSLGYRPGLHKERG